MRDFRRIRSISIISLVLLVPLCANLALANQANNQADAASDEADKEAQKLDRLISQLGSDEFTMRQAAKLELERMGLRAFDALFDAQDHADIEIALAARFLIRSMKVRFATEDDPEVIRRTLSEYSSQSSEKKRTLMHKLSTEENGIGIGALCRIARYESDDSLAKHAALLLLEIERPSDPKTAAAWAATVRKTIGDSRRSGADWALAFAQTLVSPEESVEIWDKLIRKEHATLLSSPEKTDREVVRELMRWQAELLLELDKREAALVVMRRSIGLLEKDRRQIIDWIDWLVFLEAPELVPEIANQFADLFAEDPNLIYRLAETQLQQGLDEEANATAAKAREIQPGSVPTHYTMADMLKQRELFDWAEQEYRVVIDNSEESSLPSVLVRIELSEMLHDIRRDQRAGDVLKELAELAENNADVLKSLQARERTLGEIKSRMNYFYSEHAKRNANVAEVKARLEEGFEDDPYDVDLLIAMYRFEFDDAEWKAKASKGLKEAIAHYRAEIDKYKKQAAGNLPNFPQRSAASIEWAMACNQYAWLVSNTEGDFEDAIKQSHQSLKLRPDSASFLDTLGRCYYAAGKLEEAVKYQQKAVEIDPQTQQIRRQLEMFEKELAEQQAEKNKEADTEASQPEA